MNIQVDMDYLVQCFYDLVHTPSPVSYDEMIKPLVEKYAADLGYEVTYDRKRTAYITMDGEDNSKTVLIGAHLDTIGMVVRSVDDDGKIRIRNLSGVLHTSWEGETVTIHTRDGRKYTGLHTCQSHSIHVFDDVKTLERNEDTMMILLDEPVKSKADVKALGIQNGDIISVDPHYSKTENGYIKSRYIDDKAGVASIFTMLKYLKDNNLKPKYRTLLGFSYYEEIGHGGAYLPKEVEEFVSIDIGLIGPDYDADEFQVGICSKDFYSPYDRELTSRIIEQAKKANCDYALDVFYRYGSDASVALKAGNNIYAAAFGMPVYCSHGVERTHVKSLENTAKLIVAYALDI
ncbi:MAG: M42 family metallopeptidase [Eubacteriales bacterium]